MPGVTETGGWSSPGHALCVIIGLVLVLVFASPAQACEEGYCACPVATPGPATASNVPVTVTFHGVSTLMFSAGDDRILIDGFFSRPRRFLFNAIVSDRGRIERGLGPDPSSVRAVLTAHAHHDHALDTALLADLAREAVIVGTPSVARLARAGGVDHGRLCAPSNGDEMVFGGFRVTAFHVEHGNGVPIVSRILDRPMPEDAPSGPAWWPRFQDDRNLSFLIEHGGRRFLVHPSAGARRYPALDPAPEVVFAGLGRVGMMERDPAMTYLESLTYEGQGAAPPALVIPIHWDGFTTPPGASLKNTSWPFDNVPEGFKRLCERAATLAGSRFVRLDEGAGLIWTSRNRYELAGRWTPACKT